MANREKIKGLYCQDGKQLWLRTVHALYTLPNLEKYLEYSLSFASGARSEFNEAGTSGSFLPSFTEPYAKTPPTQRRAQATLASPPSSPSRKKAITPPV